MIEYEKLYEIVKEKLSEERFKHSEGVVKRAIEFAEVYNIDKESVKLVAIAHDIAKEFTDIEVNEYLNKYNIKLDEIEKMNKNLIHAKIGAYICQNEFGFTFDMTNAIKYHTTGRENMSQLEKIIYLADATEENRNYDYIEYVDTIKANIDEGMLKVSKWVINSLLERNRMIHLDSIKCYNFYANSFDRC